MTQHLRHIDINVDEKNTVKHKPVSRNLYKPLG